MKAKAEPECAANIETGKRPDVSVLDRMIIDKVQCQIFSKQLMCEDTGISYEEPSPNAFSFNSPYGACPVCKGLGNNVPY